MKMHLTGGISLLTGLAWRNDITSGFLFSSLLFVCLKEESLTFIAYSLLIYERYALHRISLGFPSAYRGRKILLIALAIGILLLSVEKKKSQPRNAWMVSIVMQNLS